MSIDIVESAKDPRLTWKIVLHPDKVQRISGMTGEVPSGVAFYPTWEEFDNEMTKGKIVELAKRFNVELPKKASKVDLTLLLWSAMCAKAVETEPVQTTAMPKEKKPGKLANRKYEVIPMEGQDAIDREKSLANFPPQAKACLQIMQEFGTPFIPEDDLKKAIAEKADRLHTRQDPWRIFQYYRAQLIERLWIRLI